MEGTIKVARGLGASYKNAVALSVEDTLKQLKLRTDCYEVLNNTGVNRIYGDLECYTDDFTEEQFTNLDKDTQEALNDFLTQCAGEDFATMTASSFDHKKVSWRFVLTKRACTKQDMKEWVKQLDVTFPNNMKLDSSVYSTNQKMRMLGSNKDGENRPLRLVKGQPIDTLITFIPTDCETLELPKKQAKKAQPKKIVNENPVLRDLLLGLNFARFDEYESWVQMGMICFNEGADVSTWTEASKRSDKYRDGDCEAKWKTFHKGSLTIATLWKWLQEDNPEVYKTLRQNDYEYVKSEFELTHFKLKNPTVYVRIYNQTLNLLKHNDLKHLYNNMYCNNELFINKWIADSNIRTYEELVFCPKQSVPATAYNIFTDFVVEPQEGDFTAVHDVLKLISNNDETVMNYIEKWVAWILQKPSKKTGTCIVVQGDQGIGKDTYFDFVGKIFGDYFFNTNRAEEDVFTRFNGHLKQKLFLKFEEASFLINKKNESALKSLITCEKQSFEIKGIDPITLNNYFNIVMTTNNEIPVHIEQTDRRFVLIKGSSDRRGDLQFWNRIHDQLDNPAVIRAYAHHLLNLDLTGFNPRERPITEYYEEVKQAFVPYHARYFQRILEISDLEEEERGWTSRQLFDLIKNANPKFELTEQKFGRDMKLYPDDVLAKTHKRTGKWYSFNPRTMVQFLKTQKWWIEY